MFLALRLLVEADVITETAAVDCSREKLTLAPTSTGCCKLAVSCWAIASKGINRPAERMEYMMVFILVYDYGIMNLYI